MKNSLCTRGNENDGSYVLFRFSPLTKYSGDNAYNLNSITVSTDIYIDNHTYKRKNGRSLLCVVYTREVIGLDYN